LTTMRRRLRFRLIRAGVILAIAAGITIATNVALLGYATNRNDPVGRLSTKQDATTPNTSTTPTTGTTTTPGQTTTTSTTTTETPTATSGRPPSSPTITGPDDHGGSGKGNSGSGKGTGGKGEDD
jgi:hypothetical protein